MRLFTTTTILPFLAALPACLSIPVGGPLQKRDAPFEHVKTRLTKSTSGVYGDPAGKYFHESTFHPHYDGRFADKVLPYQQQRDHLVPLVQTYLATMRDIGAVTWIMHGTLLGWWWNQEIMPWDSDIDVQVSESSMRYLADYYNMTVHHYKLPGVKGGRDYMLEINPNYVNGSVTDRLNMIDARWIDMDSGLFIDITTLRRNETAEALGMKGMMMCKDKHHYRERDIFPLRESVFENVTVNVPYAYTELLEEEYGPKALTLRRFQGHEFDSVKMKWVPYWEMRKQQRVTRPTSAKPRTKVGVPDIAAAQSHSGAH